MSKVSEQASEALLLGNYYLNNNTKVECTNGCNRMYLYGNLIAEKSSKGLKISSCGWNTVTTKSRLNKLPGVHIRQSKGQWILNDVPWDGAWIFV